MTRNVARLCCFICVATTLFAAPKQHAVSFGRWTTVKWFAGEDESSATDVKIRPLLVDGQMKEFTVSPAHVITERIFVVQRMYRLNDSLQQESGAPRWRWEKGGWLVVDRNNGKVQAMPLTGFDAYYSAAAWFRDYAAYCALSDDGKGALAVVSQVGRRKPVFRKSIGIVPTSYDPGYACPEPVWERGPTRVTFAPQNGQKFTFTVRSRDIGIVPEEEDSAELH